ncbi:hypothetical protein MASR2M79_02950 [Aminivibrio sp.]
MKGLHNEKIYSSPQAARKTAGSPCSGSPRCHLGETYRKTGFKAVQVSGFGLAATYLGLPDMAFISFTEVLSFTRNIVDAVSIPVMADADTGYGNSINAMRVTEQFIKAGTAG